MNLPAVPSQVVSPTLLLSGSEARAYAEDLAKSDMLSSFFQGSVANVLFAMELGKSYNLEPAALLQNVHVFETWKDGKCTLKAALSANLMVYLARSSGHIVTTKANPNKASCTIIRGDTIFAKMLRGTISPEELEHYSNILSTLKEMEVDPKQYALTESVWSMEKAYTAGLVKEKGNWAKYPHAMLAARAKADAVRMACEEVLITLNNTAEKIGGGFSTADGQNILTTWTHTADELGASITDEGEQVGPVSTRRSSQQAPQQPPAPARDDRAARADIAAQASADPSKAGWGKPAEAEKPRTDDRSAQVRQFVENKGYATTANLLDATLASEDPAERLSRARMILNPAAEMFSAQEFFHLLKKVIEVDPDLVETALHAVADSAPASKAAEIMQHIVLDGSVEAERRQKHIQAIYTQLKKNERLEDPAPFYDVGAEQERDVSLGKAVKIIIQPLISPTS